MGTKLQLDRGGSSTSLFLESDHTDFMVQEKQRIALFLSAGYSGFTHARKVLAQPLGCTVSSERKDANVFTTKK